MRLPGRFFVVIWIGGLVDSSGRLDLVRRLEEAIVCEWSLRAPSVDDDVFELYAEASSREQAHDMRDAAARVCASISGLSVQGQWVFASS